MEGDDMGSTGYMSCGLCHQCGKCYPRQSVCPVCRQPINLDEDSCAFCKSEIMQAMRQEARQKFMAEKAVEFERIFGAKL